MQSNKQNQNDTVDAIRHRQAERSEHITPQSEELEHEEKDLSYVDENRLTFGKILKYIGIGLVILVFALLFYRMSAQNKDYSDYFVWTDSILAAYEEKHDLSAKIQNMSS